MHKFFKNTFKLLLLTIAVLVTLWLTVLVSIYFSVNVKKVKSFTINFINKNTNVNLNIDALSFKLFPTLSLEYSGVSINPKGYKQENIAKVGKFKIDVNPLIFFTGNIELDLTIKDFDYYINNYKIDFSNLAYTYASFLLFTKYNIYINSLKFYKNNISNLDIYTSIYYDPLKLEAYTNSKLIYFNHKYNLNAKLSLSKEDIIKKANIVVSSIIGDNDISINSKLLVVNGNELNNINDKNNLLKKDESKYYFQDFSVFINNKILKTQNFNYSFKNGLDLNFITRLKIFNLKKIFPYLANFLNNNENDYKFIFKSKMDLDNFIINTELGNSTGFINNINKLNITYDFANKLINFSSNLDKKLNIKYEDDFYNIKN